MDLDEFSTGIQAHSAVLVLHDLSADSLILTKRSEQLRHHPGEICFPGGVWEIGDDNLYSTALREVYEELGIPANRITLIKELQVERTLLGTVIHPWLASIQSIKPNQLNIHEVDRLISIPMSLVENPQNYKELVVEKYGLHIKSCKFIANEELVWGATARIMKQLTV